MNSEETEVQKCESFIKRGYPKEVILRRIKYSNPEEIYEIAKCRIKMRDKFSIHNLFFDEYGLRYSTPEIVAKYRADKIKNTTIADVSCGVGIQAIFFSFTNREVLGVDIDERRLRYARKNARAYGARRIRFLQGNAFSERILKIASRYEIIFSDPSRDESEIERILDTLHPSPLKIMEKYGWKKFVFDLPPQISKRRIPAGWKLEYISINGKINRLTAYVNFSTSFQIRAVSLPGGNTLERDDNYTDFFILSNKLRNYVYLVDESIYYASLLGALQEETNVEYLQVGRRRTLATSDEEIKSKFLRGYKVLCTATNLEKLISCLNRSNVGKTTLMFSLNPREYWKIRKRIEEKLYGEEKVAIFRINNRYVVTQNVT